MPQQQVSNIKALTILHLALLVGQLLFAGIAYYLVASKTFIASLNVESLPTVVMGLGGLCVICIVAAFSIFRKKTEKIRMNTAAISEKLAAYRSASILRWAMLEAPTLLTIVAFLVTGKQPLMLIIAIMLVIFLYTKPNTTKVAAELGIREEEVN